MTDSIDLELLDRVEKDLRMRKGALSNQTLDQIIARIEKRVAKKTGTLKTEKARNKWRKLLNLTGKKSVEKLRQIDRERIHWSKKAQEKKGVKGRRLKRMKTGQWIWRSTRTGKFTKPPK